MIQEQIITTIDDIQGMLAKLLVRNVITEAGPGNPGIAENKSYGKRRKFYRAKGDLTAAARELASPEMVKKGKAAAYVNYEKGVAGVESRVMKLMKQHEEGKINIGQLEWGLKKEFAGAYHGAYVLGQRSSGYTGDLTDEDLAFLRSFRRSENQYLRKFMQAIAAEKLKLDKYRRLKMYVDTVETVFDHARTEAAPPWVEIYWVVTRGANNCKDCLDLAMNSPYDKKTLPCSPRDGSTACLSRCRCRLMIRFEKPEGGAIHEEKLPGIKPDGEDYYLYPDLYDKFKGAVPEFRFFMDKNLGKPEAARKEFLTAVKKSGANFASSNYDDPYNPHFFTSNGLWLETQKIRGMEKDVLPASHDKAGLRKKRQDLSRQRDAINAQLRKNGLRWIRPDGYGGYSVGPGGKPARLFPKG